VEQLARLFHDGGLSRHPDRRAPALRHGTPPPALPFKDVKDMQTLLARAGFDVGKIDGFLGLKTRQAVKAMQVKYGLPADSYPTAELLARMRGG
jgi:hypothetical protein